jgi:hypothetical protein
VVELLEVEELFLEFGDELVFEGGVGVLEG